MRLAAVVVILFAIPAFAGPFGVRLNYAADPSTSIAISWNSDDPTDNEVHWGTSADALSNTTLVGAADQHAMSDPLGTAFSARLTGLTASTQYFYKVGHGATLYPASASTFTTLSNDPCAPVHFAVVGDNRSDNFLSSTEGVSPKYAGILADAAATTPGFLVNTGDMVRDGTNATMWNDLITQSEPTWSTLASITTQGNHDAGSVDGDGAPYNQLFELPRNSSTQTEDFYSIDVGPIHFATINSNHTTDTELTTEATWLDQDLAATAQPWKIVFFHKGIYSRGNHHTGEEQDATGNDGVLNATYIPIFDRHHVDLVLNGHSHDYERFAPSKGVDAAFGGSGRQLPAGNGTSLPATLPDGNTATTYLVSGGGGASTTDVPLLDVNCPDGSCTFCGVVSNRCNADVFNEDQTASVLFKGVQHFVSITIDGDTLTAEAIQTDGAGPTGTLDTFTIKKSTSVCATHGGEGEGEGAVGGEGEGAVGGEGEGEGSSAGEGEGEGEGEGARPGVESPGGAGAGCNCRSAEGVAPLGAVALLIVARKRRHR
jgi:MYXO-CTERM domain-containing protein